jgi:TetR/AcrR family transcriptional regulator, regulator of cefoperazone and chloramphenicol sensitivity
MVSPLEKTRKDPESVRAKILLTACRIFGAFGFHGTTIRIVAQADIFTLYYHRGERRNHPEAVTQDINHDLGHNLIIFRYSDKTHNKNDSDFKVPELHMTLPIRYDS